ncbi:MAG TPA: HAD family hydrolase [Candidatus Competibacteraceae bacterium]|nr:HAD family hydrolase [Candidatus Competibacteraceae bacterium]
MPIIRAITFDLDDTLWEVWPIIDRAEALLHDWLAAHYPRMAERYGPRDLRRLCDELALAHPAWAHDRTWLRKEALWQAAQEVGYLEFCRDSAFDVFYVARNQVEFFDEVLPVLERLAQRYTLGALSNGNADIRRVGLGGLFSFAYSAIDVGAAKPDPAMFDAARRHLGLQPSQIVHVGDHPEHDVEGARRAGFRTIWLNRGGLQGWPEDKLRADAEVHDLEELEMVLATWGG